MTILGPDISSFQGRPDFRAVKAGCDFVIIKATEGPGSYVNPTFQANRAAAHAAGLIVGLYHYAGDSSSGALGDARTEAQFFARVVGPLQPGEFTVLDYEPRTLPGNAVTWSKVWLDTATAALGPKPLIYLNQYIEGHWDWSMVAAADYGLWLAVYDFSQSQPSARHWSAPAMKQFTDRATVAGVSGGVDLNVFYGDRAALLRYGKGGTPSPAPLQESDMRLARTPDGTIWSVTDLEVAPISDSGLAGAQMKVWGNYVDVSAAELQALAQDADARRHRNEIYQLFCGGPGVAIPPPSGVAGDGGKATNLSNQILYTAAKLSEPADPQQITVDTGTLKQDIVAAIQAQPAADAAKVADLVIAQLGQRINTAPVAPAA